MRIETIETAWLGNRSYVAFAETDADGPVAVAVDPPRDIDRVQSLVAAAEARLVLVLETHWHADYVSGGLHLARAHGAGYGVPPADPAPGFAARRVIDGDEFSVGELTLRAVHTPGHTADHMSYVASVAGVPVAVFTGGCLLHGAVGRTDLADASITRALTELQWASARRLATRLPMDTQVLPTHGFGSLCSAAPAARGGESTIGKEQRVNSALTQPRQKFVDSLLVGLDAFPAYYRRTPAVNVAGPAPIDLSLPRRIEPTELAARIEAGEWVVDLRQRRVFADGHLPGTLNFDAGGNVGVYLPWLLTPGAALTLLAEHEDDIARVRRQLALVGIDEIAGCATGRPPEWTCTGGETASYPVLSFNQLSAQVKERRPTILDVRNRGEVVDGYIDGSMHIPLPELIQRLPELPSPSREELWVHCQTGFRAAIAASMLEQAGYGVVLIDEPFALAREAGLPIVAGHSQTGAWVPGSSGMRTPTSRAVSSATL
ncbi:MAG: rhodanese-like domain-containing protein [Actinomycetes bacterium]